MFSELLAIKLEMSAKLHVCLHVKFPLLLSALTKISVDPRNVTKHSYEKTLSRIRVISFVLTEGKVDHF
jgi:hypothetical protein